MGIGHYAPNISWLLPELPFLERARNVAQAGFHALEFGFPTDADTAGLKALQDELGFQVTLFNQDVPVWDEANRGYLADPSRVDEYKAKLDEALEIVQLLEVQKVMLPAGVELEHLAHEQQRDCVIDNLRYAATLADHAHVLFTIEMLNPIDNPGYFLTSSVKGIEIVAEVDHPQIKFQLDTYHVQLMEGNLIETLTANMKHIGHVQFADAPGRHEPGTGELDFESIEAAVRDAGYQGYIGLEYIPKAEGMDALAWCLNGQP